MSFLSIPYSFLESFSDRQAPLGIKKPMWTTFRDDALIVPGGPYGEQYYQRLTAPIANYEQGQFGDPPKPETGIASLIAFGANIRNSLGQWFDGQLLAATGFSAGPGSFTALFKTTNDAKLGFKFGFPFGWTVVTTGATMHLNTWHYVECQIEYQAGDPMIPTNDRIIVSAWIDGIKVLNAFLIDTGGRATYFFPTRITFCSQFDFTNVYFRAGSNAFAEDNPGKSFKVLPLRPTLDGGSTTWPLINPPTPTSHYTKVNENILALPDVTKIGTDDGHQGQDQTVLDTFVPQVPTNPFNPANDRVYGLNYSYYMDGNAQQVGGHGFGTAHVVNGSEHVVFNGETLVPAAGTPGKYDVAYVETRVGGGGPIHYSDISATDSGVECKFL